jgi:hypothetical protein
MSGPAYQPIEHHNRFSYSNILERPRYDWPNGTRLAVFTALNMEVFRFGKGKGAGIAPPEQANSESVFLARIWKPSWFLAINGNVRRFGHSIAGSI